MNSEAIYLYCFARPGAASSLATPGVGGDGRLFEARLGDAAAVVGRVPLGDFCGEAAESRLQDPDWIIPRACQHERVIEEVMAHSPVLPARFGAVFTSLQKVEELLRGKHEEIERFLDDAADKEEWAVKGFLNAETACEWLMARDPGFAEQAKGLADSPGARYFQEKRLRAAAHERVKAWCRGAAEEVSLRLEEDAVAACPLRVRPEDSMVLHSAFLLRRSRVADFVARVERLSRDRAERGLELVASGPWPLYSFCPGIGGAVA